MSSDIMLAMAKNIIHISEAEAASDVASVLARVRAGAEIVIGDDARPVAVVRPAEPHVRRLSESLRLAKEHAFTVPGRRKPRERAPRLFHGRMGMRGTWKE